jgi:dihydrofolate synthase/folylpolyglutamate synthase
MPPTTLVQYAQDIGAKLWRVGHDFNYQGDRQQWRYLGPQQRRNGLPYPALRGANQLLNAAGVLAALEAMAERLPVSQQAVRQGLLTVEIPGRFQVLPGSPTVILDVAHNPHAAAVLANNLEQMGFYPNTHAVFSMLRDKDVAAVIKQLGQRIAHWHLAPSQGPRGLSVVELQQHLTSVLAPKDPSFTAHNSVAQAYRSALDQAHADDRICVFGSFLTVAEVMAERAAHAA